jgi:hypothetical protein
MSENMTDIYFTAIEMDGCNQPVFVAANIENDPVIQFVSGGENLSQFGKTIEFGLLHDLEPTHQRRLAVGMFLPKLDQRFAGDDVHKGIVSRFEIKIKADLSPAHGCSKVRKRG